MVQQQEQPCCIQASLYILSTENGSRKKSQKANERKAHQGLRRRMNCRPSNVLVLLFVAAGSPLYIRLYKLDENLMMKSYFLRVLFLSPHVAWNVPNADTRITNSYIGQVVAV